MNQKHVIFKVCDPRFHELFPENARFEPVSVGHGGGGTEGVSWWPQKSCIIFTDMVKGTICKWDPATYETSVLRAPSNITNGTTIDRQGRLICCEHASSMVTRMHESGRYMEILASHYDGKELNSPNDAVVDSKGRIWFTDPRYGREHRISGISRPIPQEHCGVYCIDTDGTLILARKDFTTPNGLCLEVGEETLLVNDTNLHHIRRFKIEEDCTLSGGEVVCETSGWTDGMKIDEKGNIFVISGGDIHVYSKEGEKLGELLLPGRCRNFCFGGEDLSQFFFITDTLYRVQTNTKGNNIYG